MDCNQDGLNGCAYGLGWMINDKWFCSNHWAVIRAKELATLRAAVKSLIAYRDQAGAVNFQLEKADDFINELRRLIGD